MEGVYLWEGFWGVVPPQQAQIGLIVDIKGEEGGRVGGGSTGTVLVGLSQVFHCVLQPLLSVVQGIWRTTIMLISRQEG